MNQKLLDQIIDAVLYEGFILYPYRASSKKNSRQRFTFGRVYPEPYSLAENGAEPCSIQTECLVESSKQPACIQVNFRFLQPIAREIGVLQGPISAWNQAEPAYSVVPELRVGEQVFQTWHEAVEQRVDATPVELNPLASSQLRSSFHFPGSRKIEPILEQRQVVGLIIRRQAEIHGALEVVAKPLGTGLFKVTARITNQTALPQIDADPNEALILRTMASTHTVLHAQGSAFVSLMDPPAHRKQAVALCTNLGTWPVLVGDPETRDRDTMLSSPVILYDYPEIANESPGQLFDGTEIDEILSLRILTMTDDEKVQMSQVDGLARQLLQRTESLPHGSMLKLHGVMRRSEVRACNPTSGSSTWNSIEPGRALPDQFPASTAPASATSAPIEFDDFFGPHTRLQEVLANGVRLRPGDRVRVRPKGHADLLDLALGGQTAVVEALEQDAERQIHVAVVFDNDPGKDLGFQRQPGHRFFYKLKEVELVPREAT